MKKAIRERNEELSEQELKIQTRRISRLYGILAQMKEPEEEVHQQTEGLKEDDKIEEVTLKMTEELRKFTDCM